MSPRKARCTAQNGDYEYEEIVLIDLRYVNYTILSNYVNFSDYENQDVLFLYSSRVINKSGIFR